MEIIRPETYIVSFFSRQKHIVNTTYIKLSILSWDISNTIKFDIHQIMTKSVQCMIQKRAGNISLLT